MNVNVEESIPCERTRKFRIDEYRCNPVQDICSEAHKGRVKTHRKRIQRELRRRRRTA